MKQPNMHVRIIKKYPNRRLYDTQTSAYITMEDIKSFVIQHKSIKIIDVKTEEDLTRNVLMQIILDEEASGTPIFSTQMLENLIRFYGNTLQSMMGSYLERMIQSFVEMQHSFSEKAKTSHESKNSAPEMWSEFVNMQTPLMQTMLNHYIEQSQQMLHQVQNQITHGKAIPANSFDPFMAFNALHPAVIVKRKPPKPQE